MDAQNHEAGKQGHHAECVLSLHIHFRATLITLLKPGCRKPPAFYKELLSGSLRWCHLKNASPSDQTPAVDVQHRKTPLARLAAGEHQKPLTKKIENYVCIQPAG